MLRCQSPGKSTTLVVEIREPVGRHAFYCMIRDLVQVMENRISTQGNVTISGESNPFRWETNGLQFEATSLRGRDHLWTWGILTMVVEALDYCLYRARKYNAVRFLVEIDSLGVVGGGHVSTKS